MKDLVGAGKRLVPFEEYVKIQEKVPILCVDLVVLSGLQPGDVGLIRRDTYNDAEGWCTIGGAVLRNEPISEALHRHVQATLGGRTELDDATIRFHGVVEYFADPGIGEFHDPRKHAIALTYSGVCRGAPEPLGEAHEFRWYPVDSLGSVSFGFGQDRVVERVLRNGKLNSGLPGTGILQG